MMYDPLRDNMIAAKQRFPNSYWVDSSPEVHHFPQLQHAQKTTVAIIGGGYTGLNAAIALREKGVDVVVLEANQIGWGCAGRNAGFVLPSAGRLGFSALKSRFGAATAADIVEEFHQAPIALRTLIEDSKLDVTLTEGGYLKLAHNKNNARQFLQQYDELPSAIQQRFTLLSADQVQSELVNNPEQHGGLYHASSFGVNPKRLISELGKLAKQKGVKIYHQSPVISYEKAGTHQRYKVQTELATIESDYVILASNAYTPNKTLPALYRVQFPVLSSILVTHPLAEHERRAFSKPGVMCMDTRAMKYYYRLLPDNRLLFGGRGAILGKNHDSPRIRHNLIRALQKTLPGLKEARLAYFWSGWVDITYDDIPHVGQFPKQPNVYYATGYCGSAVAFAPIAGKRLAQMITEPDNVPQLPIYNTFAPAFPFAQFRRIGLWGYYQWLNLQHLIGR